MGIKRKAVQKMVNELNSIQVKHLIKKIKNNKNKRKISFKVGLEWISHKYSKSVT